MPDKFEYLNQGKVGVAGMCTITMSILCVGDQQIEGVAYRGRVMVEINMELGKLPTTRVEEIKIVDQKKLTVCASSTTYVTITSSALKD